MCCYFRKLCLAAIYGAAVAGGACQHRLRWLTLKFEPFVGSTVSRLAALAMAVSPGFVFYGRYSIHEVWILFFTMLFFFGLLGFGNLGPRNTSGAPD